MITDFEKFLFNNTKIYIQKYKYNLIYNCYHNYIYIIIIFITHKSIYIKILRKSWTRGGGSTFSEEGREGRKVLQLRQLPLNFCVLCAGVDAAYANVMASRSSQRRWRTRRGVRGVAARRRPRSGWRAHSSRLRFNPGLRSTASRTAWISSARKLLVIEPLVRLAVAAMDQLPREDSGTAKAQSVGSGRPRVRK